MPVTVGLGVWVASTRTGATLGAPEGVTYGTGVRSGRGAGERTVSTLVRPSNETRSPRPRATGASGIISPPSRRYGAMGSRTSREPTLAVLLPGAMVTESSSLRNVMVPASGSTSIAS